ncbi:hypothetical protein HMPREF9442_00317 [Paraprevotella xylaniphila YIT 11841]|uniref:Uncharacterized protein n=1 Tax=Paraprevotella xylaniphila YIT 11841 TaxID=762982 RepID=F3QQ79_9BACT|nr:hypothetical protein HMPREF9442_00317 [Paraprevotella xylaniphila YIT 11841]
MIIGNLSLFCKRPLHSRNIYGKNKINKNESSSLIKKQVFLH